MTVIIAITGQITYGDDDNAIDDDSGSLCVEQKITEHISQIKGRTSQITGGEDEDAIDDDSATSLWADHISHITDHRSHITNHSSQITDHR